jgi:Fur family ferric uptake transcriptional regulator
MLQRQELRKAGLKVTLPRLKILEILEAKKQLHLSAEDIYKELLDSGEEIGLATVYRVLTQFESAGLISRHNFGPGYYRHSEGGHYRFPYYTYRAPWYFPGHPIYNRDTNRPW